MSVRVGINGFGRIGRNIFRAAYQLNRDIEVVAVNDLCDAGTFAHLLKHDTALGTFGPPVQARGGEIGVDGRTVKFLSHRDPGDLPWRDLGVDIVIESTGLFTDASKARVHIDKGGARKVIIWAKRSSSPPSTSPSAAAASLADLVTRPRIASSTVSCDPGNSPSLTSGNPTLASFAATR